MAETISLQPKYVILFLLTICHYSMFSVVKSGPVDECRLNPPDLAARILDDAIAIGFASSDYGNIVHVKARGVLYPSTVDDIVNLVRSSYKCGLPFVVSARGMGHSVRGQDMALDGIVVAMRALSGGLNASTITINKNLFYADVGADKKWIDVLLATTKEGFAPMSWTDFLELTVGGTLSNAGISGQTFRYGPQIGNVLEMDVVTGTGQLVTCSPRDNPDLFFGVLGGLGQFGIITRARISLQRAPKWVKWIQCLYTDFNAFMKDAESLISTNALDYVEGALLLDNGTPNTWRTFFFPPSDLPKINSLVKQHGIVYSLEIAKNYDAQGISDKDLNKLLSGLSFDGGFLYAKEVSYVDFLKRVEIPDEIQAHPWLNLFIPKSRISDFNSGVFRDIVLKRNITTGPVLFYPMNKKVWETRTSAVIPDEDVFYTLGLLYASDLNGYKIYDDQNEAILDYCKNAGIKVKPYLWLQETAARWIDHFGSKWETFVKNKIQFDPANILGTGQRIFAR